MGLENLIGGVRIMGMMIIFKSEWINELWRELGGSVGVGTKLGINWTHYRY